MWVGPLGILHCCAALVFHAKRYGLLMLSAERLRTLEASIQNLQEECEDKVTKIAALEAQLKQAKEKVAVRLETWLVSCLARLFVLTSHWVLLNFYQIDKSISKTNWPSTMVYIQTEWLFAGNGFSIKNISFGCKFQNIMIFLTTSIFYVFVLVCVCICVCVALVFSIFLSVRLCIWLSAYLLPICRSAGRSVCLSVYLPIHQSTQLSVRIDLLSNNSLFLAIFLWKRSKNNSQEYRETENKDWRAWGKYVITMFWILLLFNLYKELAL